MSNLKKIAGFDVSKEFFDVCILDAKSHQSQQILYDDEGLASLIKILPPGTHCIMEATGPYYLKLAYYLYNHGFLVSVVNPLVIRRFCQMRMIRAKTDDADARLIASYGQTEEPDPWQPPTRYSIKLQQLEALVDQLQKQRTALLGQTESFTASGQMEKDIKQFLQKAVTHITRQIGQLTEKIEAIIQEHYQGLLTNVTTIPGIGKKTAIALIVLSSGFKKFDNHKQLSAYVGLCPRIYQSGTSVRGKSRICKMGMSRIRALLYVCAWSARRYNKACRDLYERLVTKGKSKRLALIAVANKLIKQAFAIAKSNQNYQENYSKNICF